MYPRLSVNGPDVDGVSELGTATTEGQDSMEQFMSQTFSRKVNEAEVYRVILITPHTRSLNTNAVSML